MPNGHNEDDRKLFAEELKAKRAKHGWTQEELAAKIHFSKTTIANIESGARAPTEQQAKALDEVFDTSGTFERMERRIRGIPFSAGFRPFTPHEAEAWMLKTFEHSLVPGLFQTEDYARVLMETYPETTPDVIEERVKARLERQSILYRSDPAPPRVIALLAAHVLDANIGGPAVMAAQMEHLAELARMPRINIQIISNREHAGLLGAFVIAETRQPPAIVYLDTVLDGQVMESPDMAEATTVLFEALRTEALIGGVSLKMIEEAAQRWKELIAP